MTQITAYLQSGNTAINICGNSSCFSSFKRETLWPPGYLDDFFLRDHQVFHKLELTSHNIYFVTKGHDKTCGRVTFQSGQS